MRLRKWEVVWDNFESTGNDAGQYLFFFRRSAESWAHLTQKLVGGCSNPPLSIRFYTRKRV